VQSYLFPIKWAVITFPIAALVIWLPFLLFHYRKYGYVHHFRMLVLYSLLLYAMTAFYLVILPLPETTDTCSRFAPGVRFTQLVPFTFVTDFLQETQLEWNHPRTYLGVLHERAFWQAVFNFMLFIPFGLYLRYYFRRSWSATLILSALGSLFFELTQYSGLYGIYNCPYRVFDVDDLMLNTAGGMTGYLITPYVTRMLPNTAELDRNINLAAKRVTYIRRMMALVIDWLVLGGAVTLFRVEDPVAIAILIALYFIVLPYRTGGQTLGKMVVRIRIAGAQPVATLKELAFRYGLLYFVVFLPLMAAGALIDRIPLLGAMLLAFAALVVFAFGIHVLVQAVRRAPLFYEQLSGTRNVIKVPKSKEDDSL